jgi:flavin reductase
MRPVPESLIEVTNRTSVPSPPKAGHDGYWTGRSISVTTCPSGAICPTILVCVNRSASAETLIAESGSFAVNFLTEEQHNIARLFSKSKLHPDERFAEGTWISMVTGAPVLDGAAASFDCRVAQCVEEGTHHIYLGRVVAVASMDTDTLLYRNGLFRRLAQVE